MKLTVYTAAGVAGKEIDIPKALNVPSNGHAIYEAIKNFCANQRQGTHKTKTRAEVSGGGIKPWRQKGTGRARSGSNTSPIWVRGGKAHGPKVHLYKTGFNKKTRKSTLLMALSEKAQTGELKILEAVQIEEPKTKKMVEFLKNMQVNQRKNLLVLDEPNKNVLLSGRNVKDLEIKQINEISTYDVLNCNLVLMTQKSMDRLIQGAGA